MQGIEASMHKNDSILYVTFEIQLFFFGQKYVILIPIRYT